jgi:hypothetical protein
MSRNCIHCNQEIPEARIKILPATKSCVACSETARVYGFPMISSKTTYSELQIVSEETAQELHQKQDRKGSISTGVQFKTLPPPKLSNFE